MIGISSIHLLQVFLNVHQYTEVQLMWLTFMHLAFVASALLLGFLVLQERLLPVHFAGIAVIFIGLVFIDGRLVKRFAPVRAT